jgi:hypothetical protein
MAFRAGLILLLAAWAAGEDQLVLIDGRTLSGQIVSEDAQEVHFAQGTSVQVLPRTKIRSITRPPVAVTPGTSAPAVPAATATPAAVAAPVPVGLPTLRPGSVLVVRTGATLDASLQRKGYRIPATLAEDAAIDGVVVLPKGTLVEAELSEAERGGRLFGRSVLEVRIVSVTIDQRTLPIATDAAIARGDSETITTVQNTASGAVIGAIIDGGHGAGVGAGIGVGVSLLTRKDGVHLPVGSLLDVRLTAPFSRTAP